MGPTMEESRCKLIFNVFSIRFPVEVQNVSSCWSVSTWSKYYIFELLLVVTRLQIWTARDLGPDAFWILINVKWFYEELKLTCVSFSSDHFDMKFFPQFDFESTRVAPRWHCRGVSMTYDDVSICLRCSVQVCDLPMCEMESVERTCYDGCMSCKWCLIRTRYVWCT